jgi:hypothetical protein
MIVIPMAGMSRRFTEAGYDRPKYMLPLAGRSVFAHAIGSFSAYFDSLPFLFIARDLAETHAFIETECAALGLREPHVQILQAPTAGQAETVELGLSQAGISGTTPLTIFNIDTFRPGFRLPNDPWFAASTGYLEVFRGSGANWSYVRPQKGDEPVALETAEKRPISDLCCTGLYHFAAAADFHDSLAAERAQPSSTELYVAPLYNHLIRAGQAIHYKLVEETDIVFCGVPAEYEALRAEEGPR